MADEMKEVLKSVTRKFTTLVEKWEVIADRGEGTAMTDSFNFRCGMQRCAAELLSVVETSELQWLLLLAAGQEMRESIRGNLAYVVSATSWDAALADLLRAAKEREKEGEK